MNYHFDLKEIGITAAAHAVIEDDNCDALMVAALLAIAERLERLEQTIERAGKRIDNELSHLRGTR